MCKSSFSLRTTYDFLQCESFSRRNGRAIPNQNRVLYSEFYERTRKSVGVPLMKVAAHNEQNWTHDFSRHEPEISCPGRCAGTDCKEEL
jgi:hypothetical protein